MNRRQLAQNVGRDLYLRPMPWRRFPGGAWLPLRDDAWHLNPMPGEPGRYELQNTATGHAIKAEPDLLHSFHSLGKLILRDQLIIEGYAVRRGSRSCRPTSQGPCGGLVPACDGGRPQPEPGLTSGSGSSPASCSPQLWASRPLGAPRAHPLGAGLDKKKEHGPTTSQGDREPPGTGPTASTTGV